MKTIQIISLSVLFAALSCNAVAYGGKESKEKKIGNHKHAKFINFADGMFYDDCLTFEIGQLIKLKNEKVKVSAVNLYLFDGPIDSMSFRVRLYRYLDGQPHNEITNQEIIQTHAIQEGWLHIDLSEYNLNIEEDFVVALQVERDPSQSRDLNYEVRLLGGNRSFYRKNDQLSWTRPPHHYKMYVNVEEIMLD